MKNLLDDDNQVLLKVRYKYSKHKGDISENVIDVNVYYRTAEALLYGHDYTRNRKLKRQVWQHISSYEALNNHIASSVEIMSIE